MRQTMGFSPLMGYNDIEDETLFFQNGGFYLFSITCEERKINRAKLSRLFANKKLAHASELNISVIDISENDCARLQELAINELLSKTASEETYVGILVDIKGHRLSLSDGSEAQRKKTISLLQKIFPNSTIGHYETDSISILLTSWLSDTSLYLPSEIDLLHSVRLIDSFDGRAGLTNHQLECQEVTTLLENGKHVVEIEVTFLDRLSFKLTEHCHLKSIKILKPVEDIICIDESLTTQIDVYKVYWSVMFSELAEFYIWLRKLIDSNKTAL